MTILFPDVAPVSPAPLNGVGGTDKPEVVPASVGSSTFHLRDGMVQGVDNVNADGVFFPAWRSLSGTEFNTRPTGYAKHREKEPSLDSLYECVALDILESSSRVKDIASKVELMSSSSMFADASDQKWQSPEYFIVSVAIPTEAKMSGKKNDGRGYTVIVYSKMKAETRSILQKLHSQAFKNTENITKEQRQKVNAVRLFEKWCASSPDDPTFQGRFKVVPDALNLGELGLPSWIVRYKNKPLLIKRSGITGTVYKHGKTKSLEFHINFHAFPYLARQGFAYLKDSYKYIIANAGFVIEGRDDEELPEVIISCFQTCNPDPATGIQAEDFFNGTSAMSGMPPI